MSVDISSALIEVPQIVGERPVLLTPGPRELWFDGWTTSIMFGRPKLTLWFIWPGDQREPSARIPRHYNAANLVGKPGPSGLFQVGWQSDYLREYARYFEVPSDNSVSPARYADLEVIWGDVKTVTTNSKRGALPKGLQYSVVAELLPPRET